MDDGSTDDTPAVMARYGDHVTYHRLAVNGDIADARSTCRLARGELIAFQDDDDLMPPDRIATLHDALCRFPTAVYAVGDMAIIDESGQRTGRRWLPERTDGQTRLITDSYAAVLWPTLPVLPHTTLFRRADGERIGWFDETFRYAAEDKDFFARLAQLGPVVYVPEVVSLVRRGHASLTHNSMRTEYWAMHLYRKHLFELRQAGGANGGLAALGTAAACWAARCGAPESTCETAAELRNLRDPVVRRCARNQVNDSVGVELHGSLDQSSQIFHGGLGWLHRSSSS